MSKHVLGWCVICGRMHMYKHTVDALNAKLAKKVKP